ncbi:hypothetical protein DUNSADRAFT_14302 [Dunaliella salina]|uniref:Uncharacterized protein n=1 Tax=Dunaliella salina TaxID=3046 RepID=A0ABQ7H2P3_DUNSA|nr:hypothetical protein DUNSADRAFT_14302 [Dunaliella salina]|eukprot:KAF5841127.1 hypothetical protein DUNSADRAFT_14302 [Dunaliella salina]
MALRQLGRALAKPFVSIGLHYDAIARKKPLTTGIATTVIKTSAADLIAQKVVERREEIDWRRQGLFAFFGFAYLGGFQYYLYNSFFASICKPITNVVGHLGVAPVKVFIDQCIHHPLCYFPCFYSLKGLVEGRSIEKSLEMYRHDLWDNCLALWSLWVPLQFINFAFVPRHLRIPFVAGISLAWTIVLSTMRGGEVDTRPAETEIADIRPEALLKMSTESSEQNTATGTEGCSSKQQHSSTTVPQ